MKISCSLLFCFLLAAVQLPAQTKKIAFKSHSGSRADFKTAFDHNLFDMELSNFGMAPESKVKFAQLDSVIFISEDTAIMVTSLYCKDRYEYNDPKLWQAGRNLAVRHPLLSKQHSLDSIKGILMENYHFKNNVRTVKFIGYDNKKAKTKKSKKEGLMLPETPTIPPARGGNQLPLLLTFTAFLTLLISLFAGRLQRS